MLLLCKEERTWGEQVGRKSIKAQLFLHRGSQSAVHTGAAQGPLAPLRALFQTAVQTVNIWATPQNRAAFSRRGYLKLGGLGRGGEQPPSRVSHNFHSRSFVLILNLIFNLNLIDYFQTTYMETEAHWLPATIARAMEEPKGL